MRPPCEVPHRQYDDSRGNHARQEHLVTRQAVDVGLGILLHRPTDSHSLVSRPTPKQATVVMARAHSRCAQPLPTRSPATGQNRSTWHRAPLVLEIPGPIAWRCLPPGNRLTSIVAARLGEGRVKAHHCQGSSVPVSVGRNGLLCQRPARNRQACARHGRFLTTASGGARRGSGFSAVTSLLGEMTLFASSRLESPAVAAPGSRGRAGRVRVSQPRGGWWLAAHGDDVVT